MKKRILLLAILFLIPIAILGQSSKIQPAKAQFISPDYVNSNATVMPSKNMSRVSANQLGFTDYDYAGNGTVNEQVWPYDIDSDGSLDPVGCFMQRFNVSEDGTRRVVMFLGLGGEFTTLDVSDRTAYSGWGTVQSITVGPWAGHAAFAYHVGGVSTWTVYNLADFSTLYFAAASDVAQNFPTFSYLDDGTISLTGTDAVMRLTSAADPLTTTEVGQQLSIGPSEYPIRRSPNGQYLTVVTDNAVSEVRMYVSNDGGATWSDELIGTDGDPILNRPGSEALFTNFGQRSYCVDNAGVVHVGMNGYSMYINGTDTSFIYPAVYWNSRDRDWIAISDPAEEGSDLDGIYPGNGIGNSYPTPAVTPDGNVVAILYQAPEYDSGVVQTYPGDGLANSYECFYTDIKLAVSPDGGATFNPPVKVAGELLQSDVFPSAYDWLTVDGDQFTIRYMWMTDAIPGCSLFSENSESEDTYWSYDEFTFTEDPIEPTTWATTLVVSDAGGRAGLDLPFGLQYNATDGLDAGLGESELPPLPPAGAFDARFIFPDGFTASLKDYRSNEIDEATWTLHFQPGAAGFPITLSWDPTDFTVTGSWRLTDAIDGSIINEDMTTMSQYIVDNNAITQLKIVFSKQVCTDVTYNSGWNLLSVPVLPDNNDKTILFPDAISNAFLFDNGYQIAENLNPGLGYWLKFAADGSAQICGLPVDDNIVVKTGWNMIGVYNADVPVDQITSTPAGIVTSNYFGFSNGYQIMQTLSPGGGYWVKVSEDGVLQLNSTAKRNAENRLGVGENWARVEIKDAVNNKTMLYFSDMSVGEMALLPPKPPTGIYDVRFLGDKYVEIGGENWKTLDISSAVYPISISAVDGSLEVRITSGDTEDIKTLNENESLIIEKESSSIMLKGSSSLPLEYSLEQNYPNPFNPTTTIRFSIPKTASVNLSVFNILGQKVLGVIDSQLEAGFHSINLDASNLSSGVYFYRIQAESFVESKKMILIK